uniref:Alanine--glyoxylate aminotransferase 2, mitochondrial n=1 Tax=Romanomermis culicivorax TaxID=13658 RepID=A0A915IGA4_ROMCU
MFSPIHGFQTRSFLLSPGWDGYTYPELGQWWHSYDATQEALQHALGAGGTVQFPREYVKRAFQLVRQYGGICISDEVQTGFGRRGENFWGYEMHGVQPDMVIMAKGIANGFPMAALVTRREIGQSLAQAFHFNTFGGNPLACTAASAVLD